MGAGAIVTDVMRNTLLNRGFKSSPDYSAITSGSIGTNSTSPSVNDTGLGSVISGWNNGDDYKGYESGYPSFNETDKTVSTRVFVSSTVASGQTITEYADFNSDTSARIGGRFVFTGISKTPSIQVYVTPKYKLT